MINFRKLFIVTLFLTLISFLIFGLDYVKETNNIKMPGNSLALNATENSIRTPGSSSSFYWRDNYGNYHSTNLRISKSLYEDSKRNRNNDCNRLWDLYNDVRMWPSLYVSLINHDNSLIPSSIFNEFQNISKKKYYSDKEFADVIVSCIQSMDYVRPYNDCDIYAPLELLRLQRGDCDSKTVLLALLLNRFGYDVIIINDLPNSHSMLAINMPHSGRYITFKGKRYYAWETTTKGWKPGMLPPDYARWNMDNYWIPFVWFQ